jgi:hypothetical protein
MSVIRIRIQEAKVRRSYDQVCYSKTAKVSTKIILVVLGLLLFGNPEVGLAQTSYECVCRGGGNLYFSYTPFSNFFSQPQIWIDQISKSSIAVGNNFERMSSLQPGQCAWLDRPIHPNEPSRIIIPVNYNQFSISWHQSRVMGISSELYYINNLQDPNRFQSFLVYNDRRGNFIMTQVGRMR